MSDSMEHIKVECAAYEASAQQLNAVRLAITAALSAERAADRLVSVVLTDDPTIHEYNLKYRMVDRPTDVLSFPADEGDELLAPPDGFLGDIMISVPRAEEQGNALGHSTERELMFLSVHGTLHLLGYDHIESSDEAVMLQRQREIMAVISCVSSGRIDFDTIETLIRGAEAAKERAYAPYSDFRAGACLKAASGRLYHGCNIENASYGAANCAERTALFRAVYEGERAFDALAVISDSKAFTVPCGICRQVLNEFCKRDMPVICANIKGQYSIAALEELLPMAFSKETMKNGI